MVVIESLPIEILLRTKKRNQETSVDDGKDFGRGTQLSIYGKYLLIHVHLWERRFGPYHKKVLCRPELHESKFSRRAKKESGDGKGCLSEARRMRPIRAFRRPSYQPIA